jgi:hypothetical protein
VGVDSLELEGKATKRGKGEVGATVVYSNTVLLYSEQRITEQSTNSALFLFLFLRTEMLIFALMYLRENNWQINMSINFFSPITINWFAGVSKM